MVCFNEKKLCEVAKLLRGWGRSSAVFNKFDKGIGKDLTRKLMVFFTMEIYI